jgi:hypothetical protein
MSRPCCDSGRAASTVSIRWFVRTIVLFRKLAEEGLHLDHLVALTHEVDVMSDRVVLAEQG